MRKKQQKNKKQNTIKTKTKKKQKQKKQQQNSHETKANFSLNQPLKPQSHTSTLYSDFVFDFF